MGSCDASTRLHTRAPFHWEFRTRGAPPRFAAALAFANSHSHFSDFSDAPTDTNRLHKFLIIKAYSNCQIAILSHRRNVFLAEYEDETISFREVPTRGQG